MDRSRLAVLACLVPLSLCQACDAGTDMNVLSWDSTPDAFADVDEGRDTRPGNDVRRDVAPWDPGFDAPLSDVADDAGSDGSPVDGLEDGLEDGALPEDALPDNPLPDNPLPDNPLPDNAPVDDGLPDSIVVDTAADPSPADLPSDARPDTVQDVARDAPSDVGPDGLTCMGIVDCARACQYSMTCVQECLDRGYPTARQKAQALLECTLDACSEHLGDENALQNCVIQNCPSEGMACFSSQPGSCPEIVDCALACRQDFACVQDCQDGADPAARAVFGDLMSCILEFCLESTVDPTLLAACVMESCPAQYEACQAGS